MFCLAGFCFKGGNTKEISKPVKLWSLLKYRKWISAYFRIIIFLYYKHYIK